MFDDNSLSGSYNFGPNFNDNVSVKSVINIAQNFLEDCNQYLVKGKTLELSEIGLSLNLNFYLTPDRLLCKFKEKSS